MDFIVKINFTEKSNLKISNWTTKITSSLDNQNIATFKIVFSDIIKQIGKIKKRKYFYEIQNLSFYLDNSNLLTIMPEGHSNLNNEMTCEYFINLINGGLSNIDTAKILKTNFSFIVYLIPQTIRNQINNLIKDQDHNILSNGKKIVSYIRTPLSVNVIEDPLNIKKEKYFTKVKYRNIK